MSLKWFIFLPFLSLACQPHQVNLNAVPPSNSPTPIEIGSPNPQNPAPAITPTPEHEISFGKGLKIVPMNIKLENEARRYQVDVIYPQIEGSKSRGIQNLNRQIKNLVTRKYQWLLGPPTREDRREMQQWPEVFNSVDLDYEVVLATDKVISIYFLVYSYGLGAAHSVQESFTVNFDLESDNLIPFTSLFQSNVTALRFISEYCTQELSNNQLQRKPDLQLQRELAPLTKNYESWNITNTGLRFNFDACRIGGCAEGKKAVEIKLESLKEMLNPKSPVNSLVTRD